MKKLLFLIILLIPQLVLANTFIEKKVNGYTIKVIEYDLNSKIYDIKVVKTDDATTLGNLLKSNNAISGINGVFFCPTDYDWCNTDKSFTDNERYIEGKKYANYLTTGDRAVFGWTVDKKPFIYQSGKINMDWETEIYYGLGNYPLLLNEGQNMLEEYWDKGLIDNKMKVKATRNFICSNKEKKNIYFGLVYDATIEELVGVLKDFGCFDALNLDAGLSTVFMYNNKYLVGPQKRDILDAVVITRKGLDINEIENIGKNITNILISDIEKRAKNNKIKYKKILSNYINAFSSLRKKIYEKYSTDIIEKNTFIGEMEKVGYKIEIKSLKVIKFITLINSISGNLEKIKKDIEKNEEE